MSDELDKSITEGLAKAGEINGYECRNCGLMFDNGRDGRQHMFSEHDNPKGLKPLKE